MGVTGLAPTAALQQLHHHQQAAVTMGWLWAVEQLAHPLIVRFRFYYRTDRLTNAVDRPE
jgi:hypothetical protein